MVHTFFYSKTVQKSQRKNPKVKEIAVNTINLMEGRSDPRDMPKSMSKTILSFSVRFI